MLTLAKLADYFAIKAKNHKSPAAGQAIWKYWTHTLFFMQMQINECVCFHPVKPGYEVILYSNLLL